MSKIFRLFVNIIFIVIITILAGYFLLRVNGKIEIYCVTTGSMEEKIHVGDYILIYRKNNYNVGDVVTYTSNGGFVTHRIIEKDGRTITTKGDANNAADEQIKESSIVGKVIISGGILNIIIDYKYAIAGVLLSLYLISCYIGSDEKEENKDDETNSDDNKELISETINEEIILEENNKEVINDNKEEELLDTSKEEMANDIQEEKIIIDESPKEEKINEEIKEDTVEVVETSDNKENKKIEKEELNEEVTNKKRRTKRKNTKK